MTNIDLQSIINSDKAAKIALLQKLLKFSNNPQLRAELENLLTQVGIIKPDSVQQVDDSPASIDAVRTKLTRSDVKLTQISIDLEKAVTDNARETITKLEIAMTRDYDIAVFVRGDYDESDEDEAQKQRVLRQAVLAFEEAENRADAGLKSIAGYHSQVVELQNTDISSAKEEIRLMIEMNANELRNTEKQIASAQVAANNTQSSLDRQTQAVEALQQKVSTNAGGAAVGEIFWNVVHLGLPSVVNNGQRPDPFGFYADLLNARMLRDKSQEILNDANAKLNNLNAKRVQLDVKLTTQREIQASLPVLQSSASITESRCIMLQSQFGFVKDTATKLLLSVKQVQNGAIVAEKMAFTKLEFAEALLGMCSDVLIDSRLIDEVQLITGELSRGWGSQAVPVGVKGAMKLIEDKIAVVSKTPSIKVMS